MFLFLLQIAIIFLPDKTLENFNKYWLPLRKVKNPYSKLTYQNPNFKVNQSIILV